MLYLFEGTHRDLRNARFKYEITITELQEKVQRMKEGEVARGKEDLKEEIQMLRDQAEECERKVKEKEIKWLAFASECKADTKELEQMIDNELGMTIKWEDKMKRKEEIEEMLVQTLFKKIIQNSK